MEMSATEATNFGHFVEIMFEDMMVNATSPSLSSLLGDEWRHMANFVNRAIIGQIFAVVGMGTNILNMAVFYKMGFKESINVSLFGLAMSDFMSCVTLFWSNLCTTPSFYELDLPFKALDVRYVTGGWTHVTFVKITSCITAYVAFERCICVTFPLKVKNIITPKKVKIIIVSAYIFFIGLLAPAFYINRLERTFYPDINKTLVGLVFSHDRVEIERWYLPLSGVFFYWFFFIFTIICTVVLVVTLKKNSEWRNKASAASGSNQMSSRDTRVSTLVVMVSVVFIACFTPQSMTIMAMSIESEISVGGRYYNLMAFIFSFNFLFETINACINTFIYYFRSSKYKDVFDQMFWKKTISDK